LLGFRRACRFLHRETAFLVFGLTIAYAVSGIAVNHVHHWNPNYRLETTVSRIEPVPPGETEQVTAAVLERLALAEPVKNVWRPGPDRVQVFLEGATLDVDLLSGEVTRQSFAERPVFFELNFLHLNKGKGLWTIVADAYAGALLLLATTGIFLVRGRRGIAGRGGIWMALGIALPLLYLLLGR
jgi:hypothetical protein